jgi:hypothetical protein
MKQKITILLLFALFAGNMFSQNTQSTTLNEFVIEKDNNPQVFYKSQGCTPNDGVIVFNTTIPNLKFAMPDTPRRLRSVPAFDKANNRYVLCLQPTDTEIGGYTKYSIDIIAAGYKNAIIDVREVHAGETQYFKINPKIVDNTVEITAFDKDGNPLQGARVGIKGTDYEVRGDNKGVYKVELPNSRPATLVISHRLYSDTKEITATPGEKQKVRLYKLKPVTSTYTGYNEDNKKFCFGIFGGLSVSNMESDAWYYEDAKSSKVGFYASMLFEIKLNKTVSLQPELLFVQKGNKGQVYTSDYYMYTETGGYIPDVLVESTMQLNYIELPINLIFNISTGKIGAFFIGAGPSISYGISGKLRLNPSKEGITFYLSDEEKEVDVFGGEEPVFSRFDLGLNFLAGYRYKRFFVRAGYDLGLTNIATNKDEGWAKFTNNCFNLSVGVKL